MMKVAIFDDPKKVGIDELQNDLLKLPTWRCKQALAYHKLIDQVQCVKAFVLLQQCLAEDYKIYDIPTFQYGIYGKPCIPQVHFNLSHCANGVLCVVDNKPVGCDIEIIPSKLDFDIINACFNSEEQEHIKTAKVPSIEFTSLWTKKEALLKLKGIGLIDELPDLLISPLANNVKISTVVCPHKGYIYSIAQ